MTKLNDDFEIKKNLRVDEVAVFLDVSKRTVYRLLEACELEAFRVGCSVRIPRESLDRYVKKQISCFQQENLSNYFDVDDDFVTTDDRR